MTPLEEQRIQQRRAAIAANAGVYNLGQKGADYWAQDLAHFKQYQQRLAQRKAAGGPPPSTDATTVDSDTPTPVDPMQSFLDQIKPLLQRPDQPAVTPFDQSGFYNEADTKALADQEYDPFYAKEKAYGDTQNAEEDRQRLEAVNSSGGTRSSAYDQEMALRRQALARASEQQANQQKAEKSGFVTNRRNEAFQRYLQSVGAVTS